MREPATNKASLGELLQCPQKFGGYFITDPFMGSAVSIMGAMFSFCFLKGTLLHSFQHFSWYCHFWVCGLICSNKNNDASDKCYTIKQGFFLNKYDQNSWIT